MRPIARRRWHSSSFDSAGREACTVRETRTNTPLQALNLMNDVTFVESSRMMAERMMTEGGSTPAERVAYGYRLATAREPGARRSEILVDSFHHHLDNYETDRKAALALACLVVVAAAVDPPCDCDLFSGICV